MSIEHAGQTEEMRHIPKVEVLLRRVDTLLRKTGEVLLDAAAETRVPQDHEFWPAIDAATKWFESVDATLRPRAHADSRDSDHRRRFQAALEHATTALASTDRTAFRRRAPFHLFERSKGECVVAAIAAAEVALERAAEHLSPFVSDIYYRLAAARYPALELPPRLVSDANQRMLIGSTSTTTSTPR